MNSIDWCKQQLHIHRGFAVQFLSILVAAHGVFILAITLLAQLAARHGSHLSDIVIDLPLLVGLSLIYLSTLLRRRKRSAWLVTMLAYTFYLGLNVAESVVNIGTRSSDLGKHAIIRAIILPVVVLGLLLIFEREFVVKSDLQGFRVATRFAVIMLVITLVYGVAGFSLMDQSDFHQEISVTSAAHYTIDQFDLTTAKPLHPYTKRAHLFVDSLSFVSVAAIVYAAISLFQPLRVRLADQSNNRQRLTDLLQKYGGLSEDFFKLWPHDKQYFFDAEERSALAFHVYRGVALCMGDPAGDSRRFGALLNSFQNLCFSHDWLPALIHVEEHHRRLYNRHGFTLQKIGQEAVVDLNHFQEAVARNKYFRHIRNKFDKQSFSCEMLAPPHHPAVLDRLQAISKEWLGRSGRVERGFVMGYYSSTYMQQCRVAVVRDAAGTIQAFMSQVPADFDKREATFDMLRHTAGSPSNINDFLLLYFIAQLHDEGYQQLNLGLCPLVGLDEDDEERRGLIDGVLRFAYANGDRFYSFSGLHRFKAKYEPTWRDRYIAYQGGVRGFSRTTTALMRVMRVKLKN